jgi:phosphatidylserine/phosphatidylglycerophosphate/cardiolipin synthase-like enzyme
VRVQDWFLTSEERGNPASSIPAWSEGNAVEPLVHGATYFERLMAQVRDLRRGDHLFLAGWRGDADELVCPEGPTVGELLAGAARRGVLVKGLLWRSHTDELEFSKEENQELGEIVGRAGGEILLDHRVRRAGSHHQKFVVLRHPGRPGRDVAFAGGIDLCRGRRDDARHGGDAQAVPMNAAYGEQVAWHDVQLELRGPVVGLLDTVFRERWNDPAPLDVPNVLARLRRHGPRADRAASLLPPQPPAPAPAGTSTVQLLRTYPTLRPAYPFAPRGERSVARGYGKVLRRARRLIYVEDQYMWSPHIARLLAAALRRSPELHLVVIVPRHPDVDGALALPPNHVGRTQAIEVCRRAAADRVHVFDLENHEGSPVYVHAKLAVVDDTWASVGSANLNRRSWTHDSELACAVLDEILDGREPADPGGLGDGARRFARELRLELMREHLDREPGDDENLLDPDDAVRAVRSAADELDRWHREGATGPRPPGRLRPHRAQELPWHTKLWAVPLYRLVYDPDGRPLRLRLRQGW